MTPYPDADIRAALYIENTPLAGIEETEHEWWLNAWSLNKKYASFRSGHSHPLRPEAHFYKQFFDVDGRQGFAAIFRAVDPPPSPTYSGQYFVGWVPPEREAELDGWVSFLNAEIAKRLGLPHIENMSPNGHKAPP